MIRIRKRKKLNQNHRLNLYKQSHGKCWYCGGQIGKKAFRLDHQHPFSKDGADSKRNLVVACAFCDSLKGNRDVEGFREFLQARLQMAVSVIFYGERIDGQWNWEPKREAEQ